MRLRKGTKEDAAALFSIIKERIEWMDRENLNSWNNVGYLTLFPLPYFEEEADNGTLFVIDDNSNVIGGAVILESDDRWPEGGSALYVHNLVAIAGTNGGSFILSEAERMAKDEGKEYLRLDASSENPPLLSYYEKKGFHPNGTVEIGVYRGIRLEKRV